MSRDLKIAMPRSGVTMRSKQIDRERVNGFNMGILCGCACLNDMFDFTDEELAAWLDGCNQILASFAQRHDDPKYVIRELEKYTDVKISFGK